MVFPHWLRSLFPPPTDLSLKERQRLRSPLRRRQYVRRGVTTIEALEDRTLLSVSALLVSLDSETKLDTSGGGAQPAENLATADPTETAVIDLPEMILVDPSVNRFDGQLIYLDFDGAEDVLYDGPVTVGPFHVPAFEAPDELAGREVSIIASVLEQLESTFGGRGLIFTTDQPAEDVEFSTIYIGGDDSAFHEYGSFLGLAEQVDERNQSAVDSAFVFGEKIGIGESVDDYTAAVSATISHELGHLLGYEHAGGRLESSHLLDGVAHGVTIVTHGFNSNADAWVDSMTDEMIARMAAVTPFQVTDVAKYELTIDSSSVLLSQESGVSYLTAASGETVIRLDWGALSSSTSLSTSVTAERIADFIFAGQTWIVEGPLHLIGHSRGASLVNALAAEFGDRGVWVDHLTFHDAVPVGSDFPMNIPENVIFADGYWRTGGGIFSPNGQSVLGAYNIQLNQSHFEGGTIGYGFPSDVHSDVHLWYHGTVDNVGAFSDVVNGSGETVVASDADYWYSQDAYLSVDGTTPTGRNDTGYAFSRVVGFGRPDAGVTQALGGNGQRNAIDWSNAVWPNLLELSVNAADLEFDVGESIPVEYYFQDADSDADLAFYLDVDRNPYNGNAIMVEPSFVQVGGTSALTFDNKNLPTDGVVPGSYYVSASITDSGSRVRWAYVQVAVTLNVPVVPPAVISTTLSGGDVNRSGIRELTFTFDQNVSIAAVTSLNLFNHTTNQTIDLTAATLINSGTTSVAWDLTGVTLPDGRYTAELPSETAVNDSGIPLAQSHAFEFHVMRGDVTGDGRVNATDFIEVDAFFDPLPGLPFRPGDANGNGRVNASDFIEVDANFNPLLLTPLEYDFGDAPETGSSFPTTLANNGARHAITGNSLFLGASRDAEADGQPDATASGDGDDEDGVSVGSLFTGTNVAIRVTSSGVGFVNGWVDFNQDGDWDDPGEQVFTDQAVVSGANNLLIAVPAGATLGSTFTRFRLTAAAGYSYDGLASDGEVEDDQLTVTAPPPDTAASLIEETPTTTSGLFALPPWWTATPSTDSAHRLVMFSAPLDALFSRPFSLISTGLRSRFRGR